MNYAPPTAPEWITASLARSEEQVVEGRAVPFEPVLDRLRASIARMQNADKTDSSSSEA